MIPILQAEGPHQQPPPQRHGDVGHVHWELYDDILHWALDMTEQANDRVGDVQLEATLKACIQHWAISWTTCSATLHHVLRGFRDRTENYLAIATMTLWTCLLPSPKQKAGHFFASKRRRGPMPLIRHGDSTNWRQDVGSCTMKELEDTTQHLAKYVYFSTSSQEEYAEGIYNGS